MTKVFLANCRPENWAECEKDTVFGLKQDNSVTSAIERGDLLLLRISGTRPNYGVKAIWYFDEARRADEKNVVVPWKDGPYEWVLKCKPIAQLHGLFNEDFRTFRKISFKIPDFPSSRIQPSIIQLKNPEALAYLKGIRAEFSDDIQGSFDYFGQQRTANAFLGEIIETIEDGEGSTDSIEAPSLTMNTTRRNSDSDLYRREIVGNDAATTNLDKSMIDPNNNYVLRSLPREDSQWRYSLRKSKLDDFAVRGNFNLVVVGDAGTSNQKVFIIPYKHLQSEILPKVMIDDRGRILFNVSQNTYKFNWVPSIAMDGKEFLHPEFSSERFSDEPVAEDQNEVERAVSGNWIFQANPRYFDIENAVRELQQLAFSANQHPSEIHSGDRVFIWSSGKHAGVIAIATVLSEPSAQEQLPEERKFNIDQERFEGEGLRVLLGIDRVLSQHIKRELLVNHPVLGSMQILKAPQGTNFKISDEQARTLLSLADGKYENQKVFQPHITRDATLSIPIIPNEEYSFEMLAQDTYTDRDSLTRWIKAIERKKQAIFYGPPGTGKTFLAESLAKHLVSNNYGFVETIQFHAAYAYEDFVQGIRPDTSENGSLAYPILPGRFLKFCSNATNRDGPCVLIIDEINRANIAQVFGELMYLLEYRDREIQLAAGKSFHVPSNVRIIGTMNTADRSIALVDHALRRRFAFLALYPNYDILKNYHANTGFATNGLINTLQQLNKQIGDSHYEIGISYFLRQDLEDQIRDIWQMEIEPYLEEYFFDQPDRASDFRWEKVKSKILS